MIPFSQSTYRCSPTRRATLLPERGYLNSNHLTSQKIWAVPQTAQRILYNRLGPTLSILKLARHLSIFLMKYTILQKPSPGVMMISQKRSEPNVLSSSQIFRMRGYANDGTQQLHEITLDLRNKPPMDQGLSLCHNAPRMGRFPLPGQLL